MQAKLAKHLIIEGNLQGKGVRPLIFSEAQIHNISGWVKNSGGGIDIYCQGTDSNLDMFIDSITNSTKLKSCIKKIKIFSETKLDQTINQFSIHPSSGSELSRYIPQDTAVCQTCLAELLDENSRRYHYPFISCTECGPRFSWLTGFPVDRENSTISKFTPCETCLGEYNNPRNRRFHAQNIHCPQCGPTLSLTFGNNIYTSKVVDHCCKLLEQGCILAVKSSSSYRLIADATNHMTITKLRQRKNRPQKPFAVMVANEHMARQLCKLSESEMSFLRSAENPILLVPINDSSDISPLVAPRLKQLGMFLPSTGFEHLLLNNVNKPIVSTSANISGQTLIYQQKVAEEKLKYIADAFIHHNVSIENPSDDSVWQATTNEIQAIRLGRGFAPREFNLPFILKKPVAALGAQDKATFALAWNNRLVISSHGGDLSEQSCWQAYQQKIQQLQRLYNIVPEIYLIDKHPEYTTNQWVKKNQLPFAEILHHHAHAASLYLSIPRHENTLVFTWDGTGYGKPNQIWGGETLWGKPGSWRRVASFKPFRLPGGDKCITEIWRTGYSILKNCHIPTEPNNQKILVDHILSSNINSPLTSSVGRLFDAVAFILGITEHTSFDGQAAMYLESLASHDTDDFVELNFKIENGEYTIIHYDTLIKTMIDLNLSIEYRAKFFHNTLAHTILKRAQLMSEIRECSNIGLCGGVFQNKLLTSKTQKLLAEHDYKTYIPQQIPCNDASISIGQVIEYTALQ